MQPDPPPDQLLDPPDEFSSRDVRIVTIGMTGQKSVEVIARWVGDSPTPVEGQPDLPQPVRWFRFNLDVKSRVVRKFMRKAGVQNVQRAEEGAYQYLKGYGPLSMSGIIVGVDSETFEDGTSSNTFVLSDVKLDEQAVLYTPSKRLVNP